MVPDASLLGFEVSSCDILVSCPKDVLCLYIKLPHARKNEDRLLVHGPPWTPKAYLLIHLNLGLL